MELIDGWKQKFPRLWSVKLSLLSSLLSGAEVGMSYYAAGKPAVFACVACAVSVGAAISRIVAQPEVTGNGAAKP